MTRRCAIYTRKSSEEGLHQSFNSLDAQREACEAYILSQKSEGWKALPAKYDDGGYSGGKMERPALQRLLADIAAGRVDVVVVYKVDRLTRSLADFARIIEAFDAKGTSFVSVTQAFNTTSSMGRLTLNVLLSFAQFEREVTGERIRDKIAASKAKGMWMGGYPPLGYAARDRSLVIVPEEAERVRYIYSRYLELGSVGALAVDLAAAGVRSKRHVSAKGEERGGTPFSHGALFHMLRNRIYLGEIVHKKAAYPGQHEPIIEQAMFDDVQAKLASNRVKQTGRRFSSAPLAGIVFDGRGARMTPAHSYGKYGGRYRYYISPPGAADRPELSASDVTRVSAPLLEELVLERVRALREQPALGWAESREGLQRIEVRRESVTLQILGAIETTNVEVAEVERLAGGATRITIPACMQPRKGSTRIAAPAARIQRHYRDRPLIAALKRAHLELGACGINVANLELQDARGLDDPYLRRIARLAFLAPDIQSAILAGHQPPGLSLKRLLGRELPLDWSVQRLVLGFG
jgi:site-specific DNA recombinase